MGMKWVIFDKLDPQLISGPNSDRHKGQIIVNIMIPDELIEDNSLPSIVQLLFCCMDFKDYVWVLVDFACLVGSMSLAVIRFGQKPILILPLLLVKKISCFRFSSC